MELAPPDWSIESRDGQLSTNRRLIASFKTKQPIRAYQTASNKKNRHSTLMAIINIDDTFIRVDGRRQQVAAPWLDFLENGSLVDISAP